jgi:protoporphyrinogen oxidase
MMESREAIVIGGGLGGIGAAHALTSLGISVLLLEKSNSVGGMSGSYQDQLGNWFDYGMHVIDEGRSEFVTRLFKQVLNNKFVRTKLKRGVVIRGQVVGYNGEPKSWPHLKAHLPDHEIMDDLSLQPTRQDISRVYGKPFADIILDEVLPSYPTLQWQKEQGVPEEKLLAWLYPWYFPKAKKTNCPQDPGSLYHQRMREGDCQIILYPKENGFGNFLNQLAAQLPQDRVEIRTGIEELKFESDAKTRTILSVSANGQTFKSDKIFWCAPLGILCQIFGIKLPEFVQQEFYFGNFTFKKLLTHDFQEVLVGDPEHLINRVYYPGLFSEKPNRTAQVEFYCQAGKFDYSDEQWRERWENSLRQIGLLSSENGIENFHFMKLKKGFITTTSYDDLIKLFKSQLESQGSNLIFPFWGVGPENINRLLPSVYRRVSEAIVR